MAEQFTELYHRWWPVVRLAASEILSGGADAEDAAQQVFLRLWQKDFGASLATRPESYFRAAGRNEALMILRRRRNQVLLTQDVAELLDSCDLAPDERVALQELRQLISGAIVELPPRCREVMSLAVVGGLTNAEIARSVGIGIGAVEKQRARGRRLFARVLNARGFVSAVGMSNIADGGEERI